MSTIINIMKLFLTFVVFLKVAQSRFLQSEFLDNDSLQKLSLYNYNQLHPIFIPHFHVQPSLGYRPIPAYDQSRYPIYRYGNFDSPFSKKYGRDWIFRTRFCWPLGKGTTTDRNKETTTEGVITTEKVENTESNTIIVEDRTINLFTSETPTTVNQDIEISQSSTTAASINATKEQEESTTINIDNIKPIDYDEPEAV